jgi:hypothetical protein
MASHQYSQYIQQKFFISFTPSNLVMGLLTDNTVYQNRDIGEEVKFTDQRNRGLCPPISLFLQTVVGYYRGRHTGSIGNNC